MRHWFRLSSYPAWAVFVLAGVFAALFAWNSANLIHIAMENFRFIRMFGSVAIMEGGLGQTIEIIIKGYASLAFYMGFKACEVELIYRWRSS